MLNDHTVLEFDIEQECPRCQSLGPHTVRRTRYGPLLTCDLCDVSWLVPAVDVTP